MASYRIVVPYAAPLDHDPGRVLRFTAHLNCTSGADARRRGILTFRELGLSTGFQCSSQPTEKDVFIEEIDNRSDDPLEIGALEVQNGVFCMTLTGPLESHTALQLDKEAYRLQRLGAESLAIDLGRVHPLSSAGLGVLLNLNDRLDLQLVRVPLAARKLLQTLGLESSVSFYDSFSLAVRNRLGETPE